MNEVELEETDGEIVEVTGKAYHDKPRRSTKKRRYGWCLSLRAATILIFIIIALVLGLLFLHLSFFSFLFIFAH